ncbi:fimbrial protein [Atlantibacter hermannii]|uniref:fimbrial protein n=1 Tax=Atlantibacter hermannii TaxID=565 RepID=UPI0028A8BF37|nr:fimbrial protein [Atlantibacter hermannii]
MVRKLLLISLMMGITHQAIGKLVAVSDGGLYVYGNVRESACRLEMDSAWQAVDLGDTTHAEINAVGKQSAPVQIKLYLLDCPEIATRMTNSNSMTTTTSYQQPGYQARFVAVSDAHNPDLIKVEGVSGIGLRLKDSQGRPVRLGQTGDTVLIDPGQNVITYTLQAERTAAAFIPGAYHAQVQFSIVYQ